MKLIHKLPLLLLLFASSCGCEKEDVGTCAYGHKCKKVAGENAYAYFPDSSCPADTGPPPKAGKKVVCAQWRGEQCVLPVEVSGDDDLVREPGQPKPPGWEPLPPTAPRPKEVEYVRECRTEWGWPCGS